MTEKKLVTDPRKCPMHNMWRKKGQCEICRLNERILQKQRELLTGSNKPTIKIGNV